MKESRHIKQSNKKVSTIKTFPVPFALEKNKAISSELSKEKILKEAFKFHAQGNISEAVKYYKNFINQGFKDHRVFSNFGSILRSLGKLKEAELSQRQAIILRPDLAEGHSNLGSILRDLGDLKQAEISTRKAIEINPDFAMAHCNLGSILRDLGNFIQAEVSLRKAIEINPNFAMAHCNLGSILRDLDNLKEAELFTRKAIEIEPNFAMAHCNLGIILRDLGCLKEAELSFRKAIEIKSDLATAYYSLSNLKFSNIDNKKWKNKLFRESILNNQSQKNIINIYFARANVLHKEKKYKESSQYLEKANKLKLTLIPSNLNNRIKKSKVLLIESNTKENNEKENKNYPESIFIVGMPRSGSTLLESILSMNREVDDLGEINILEEAFLNWKKNDQRSSLPELYSKKINHYFNELRTTTNKWLYNYQYVGIISNQIPNAKIIHCYRNPLDNILSIYRANFMKGNEYSSSLIDCTKIYLDQEEIMREYKNRFRLKIYDLNYDLLVSNPNQEIKSLISWLNWKWDDSYLSPHLNPRSISTASSVQVRSPINSKSIGLWKNYKNMLKPAIEILTKTKKYREIAS